MAHVVKPVLRNFQNWEWTVFRINPSFFLGSLLVKFSHMWALNSVLFLFMVLSGQMEWEHILLLAWPLLESLISGLGFWIPHTTWTSLLHEWFHSCRCLRKIKVLLRGWTGCPRVKWTWGGGCARFSLPGQSMKTLSTLTTPEGKPCFCFSVWFSSEVGFS